MIKKWLLPFLAFFCVAGVCLFAFFQKSSEPKETLIITMPQSRLIRNVDLNAYTLWLEEKADVNLTFNLIPETLSNDYFEQIFTSGQLKTDIIFAFDNKNDSFFTHEHIELLGAKGYILPLNDFITKETQYQKITEAFADYDLREYITASDGNIYYFPNIDSSASSRWSQSFWINRTWLQSLNLSLPLTTEDFYQTLLAFKISDPNGNGLADEIPLADSGVYDYLINSFVYNDPANMRLFVRDGEVLFAPMTQQWRQAMSYLNILHQSDLLPFYDKEPVSRQMTELAVNPDNLLGGFTAYDIADVLLPSCTDMMNKFTSLAPLKGFEGNAHSVVCTPTPQVGAFITANSKNPQKAFEVLDLMLSEEAFLIASYGEENVDWSFAEKTDFDSYGNKAVIKIQNQLTDKPQNKNFAGLGPMYVYPKYADHITWRGFDPEYLNARAYLTHLKYLPEEVLPPVTFSGADKSQLTVIQINAEQYTQSYMSDFITGKKDVLDDKVWQEYLDGFGALGIDQIIAAANEQYDANIAWRKEREK